jgi:thiamin-phosphate kinase
MNEWEWVEWIVSQAGPPPRSIRTTWQEDATVWREGSRWSVFSVDQLVEDVHFRRSWCALDVIGYKAVLRAVSDVWVQGARPRYLWVALQVPPDGAFEALQGLYRGVLQAARDMGAYVAGGDTVRDARWGLVVSALGYTRRPLSRRGARPGASVWLTGPVGWAGLGVALFERWHRQGRATPLADRLPEVLIADGWPHSLHGAVQRAVQAILRPRLPVRWHRWVTRHALATIDISDGLLIDLWRLLRVNDVGAELDETALEPDETFRAVCQRGGQDPWDLIFRGGEDYEWIVVLPAEAPRPPFAGARWIGRIVAEPAGEIRLRMRDGRLVPLAPAGWDHLVGPGERPGPEPAGEEVPVWVAETDGASLGNPGPSGYGFVIRDPLGAVRYTESGYVGFATNNVAEYTAIVRALRWLRSAGVRHVEVRTDSELTAYQLQGLYGVRSERLRPLYEEARRLLSEFLTWRVVHVPRERNAQADRLARQGARKGP